MGNDLRWHVRLEPDAVETLRSHGISTKASGFCLELHGVFTAVGFPEYDDPNFAFFSIDMDYLPGMSVIDTMIREHTVFAATFVERDQNTAEHREHYRSALAKIHRLFASVSEDIVLTNDQYAAEEYEVFDDRLKALCFATHNLLEDFPE